MIFVKARKYGVVIQFGFLLGIQLAALLSPMKKNTRGY